MVLADHRVENKTKQNKKDLKTTTKNERIKEILVSCQEAENVVKHECGGDSNDICRSRNSLQLFGKETNTIQN